MISFKYGDRAARELANKIGAGTATLVSGAATIAEPTVSSTSSIVITRKSVGKTVTSTIMYTVGTVTAGTGFTIIAAVAAGTVNTADTSVVSYHVINP